MNMFHFLKRRFALFLFLAMILPSCLLLTSPRNMSLEELNIMAQNSDDTYVYLGADGSNLYNVIAEISSLDSDKSSPVHELRKYIENGFTIGLYDNVLEVLEYAELLLKKKRKPSKKQESKKIKTDLRELTHKIRSGHLNAGKKCHHEEIKCFERTN